MPEPTRAPWTTPGIPHSTRYICPLGDWWHDEPPASTMDGVPGLEARAKETEALLRLHLGKHALEEWLREIDRLNAEVARLEAELEEARGELGFVAARATEY